MNLKTQITVFLENQPGAMAVICGLLKPGNIRIEAFTVFGTVDHGVLRMIVDDPDRALSLLEGKGNLAIQTEVIQVKVRNDLNLLEDITRCLADGGVNIEYGYGSTGPEPEQQRFYFQASNNKKAVELIEAFLKQRKLNAK